MVSNNRLRMVRKEVGMPLSELARRSGTSRQTITNIELKGQVPNGLLMLSICEALKRSPDEIFFASHVNHG
ncbi:helix-turn-helix domain-containing protein [Cohnella xylanilytica]|uniref:Helix-turn-helix domain-containing protein n=1 Tax=Cohnella xylanilytica TaxID=557555 RepID=A0A841TZF5_9BACL|nr:helix-turn-helix domain-containing protein [Cohnella xylanilytica]MBB6692338.1 helix-turn-helix domain-containing protein [Cohnella xylanilytica]